MGIVGDMETTTDIHPGKLVEALGLFHKSVGKIDKAKRGEFANYADLAAILEVITPHLADAGLAVVQTMDGEDLVTTLMHKGGASLASRTPLLKAQQAGKRNNPLHAWGAAVTYQRRYCALAILGIAAGMKDADGAEMESVESPRHPPRVSPPKQQAKPALSAAAAGIIKKAEKCRTETELKAVIAEAAKLSEDDRADVRHPLAVKQTELKQSAKRVAPVLSRLADPGKNERAVNLLGELGFDVVTSADVMRLTAIQVEQFDMEWVIRFGDLEQEESKPTNAS